MAATGRTRDVRGPTGLVVFAGVMMVLVGFLNFFYGLAAIVNDEVVVVGGHGALIADLTTWGWIHLVAGIVVFIAAFGVLTGAVWGRIVGVMVALISAIISFAFVPYYPVWSLIIVGVDIVVIWALTVHGRDISSV